MRDEVYAFDMVIIDKNGYQSDRFPIPGRVSSASDLVMIDNNDSRVEDSTCTIPTSKPRWQVYNTGSVTGYDIEFLNSGNDPCYEGAYQYGEFSYLGIY